MIEKARKNTDWGNKKIIIMSPKTLKQWENTFLKNYRIKTCKTGNHISCQTKEE